MKPEDDEPAPSDEELREAAALARALETDAPTESGDAAPPSDAIETAALLRHARAPLAVPPAHEPIAAAQASEALAARRGRRGRRHLWIAASIVAPAAAAAWLLFAPVRNRNAPPPLAIPPPSPGLLAAQAEATRGGRTALARLDEEMRAYRRRYHDGLRRRGGGEP